MQIIFLYALFIISLIINLNAFDIKIGDLDHFTEYGLNSIQQNQPKNLFVNRGLIFPYHVYEAASRGSSIKQAKSYIFIKVNYDLLNESFSFQSHTVQKLNQYQILYGAIPQVVIFKGQENEYMELIRKDPSPLNTHFIIKNSTFNNYKRSQSIFTLNSYSLQITKFLQIKIKVGQKNMYSNINKQKIDGILQNNTRYSIQGIRNNQTQRNQMVLAYFIVNQKQYSYSQTIALFNTQFTAQIKKDMRWSVAYDGFSIYFVHASIIKMKGNKKQSLSYEDWIDLKISVYRESKQKRSQHIRQPLTYLNLSKIDYLELCFSGQRLRLLIGDNKNIYSIDITTHIWKFEIIKFNINYLNILFDNQCKLLNVHSNQLAQINGIHRIKYNSNVKQSSSTKNMLIFCLEENKCKIYSKVNYREIGMIDYRQQMRVQQLITLNNSNIQYEYGYRKVWQSVDYQLIKQQSIIKNIKQLKYSYFYQSIYPYQTYHDKYQIRSKQLDKVVYYHLDTLPNKQIYSIPKDYYLFTQIISTNQKICTITSDSQNQLKVQINNATNWSICTISLPTSGLVQLKIIPSQIQPKMYICQTTLQNQSINPQIDCQVYEQTSKNQKFIYYYNNKLIKIYILRFPKQSKFPKFQFNDIQRQQLAFASTFFFTIMLVISILGVGFIFIIIFKPLVLNLMVYYGWREDLTVPTYPLSWFQLKLKIKRLTRSNFLTFTQHDPKNREQGNDCCFCLQNLARGATIAKLFCQHQFHKDCFSEWVRNDQNLRCPTCRRQFTVQNLLDFRVI